MSLAFVQRSYLKFFFNGNTYSNGWRIWDLKSTRSTFYILMLISMTSGERTEGFLSLSHVWYENMTVHKFLCFILYVWLAFYGGAWKTWFYSRKGLSFLCRIRKSEFSTENAIMRVRKSEMRETRTLRSAFKISGIRQCGIVVVVIIDYAHIRELDFHASGKIFKSTFIVPLRYKGYFLGIL